MLLPAAALPAFSQVPPTLRVNTIGYQGHDDVTAVYMGDIDPEGLDFFIIDANGKEVPTDDFTPTQPWGQAKYTLRMRFPNNAKGPVDIVARHMGKEVARAKTYIGRDAYSRFNLKELPLHYLRQQRCGYNPVHNALCHQHDGYVVGVDGQSDVTLNATGDTLFYDVTGGWHDASDYLQYLPTSANTIYHLLFAYRQNPKAWADEYDALGRPGANGLPDILDEARWGLEWLMKMNPNDSTFFNQIADDRDHRYVGAPQNDSTDYGYGPGQGRPVYVCSAEPFGLKKYKNRSQGLASSLGKFASAFALGFEVFRDIDPTFAATMPRRAFNAYRRALQSPGQCQTAPCVSPYFYEEDNWADDMELAAVALARIINPTTPDGLAARTTMLKQSQGFMDLEPVTPWMGADSARHYQFYPFINLGHYELATTCGDSVAAWNMYKGIAEVQGRGFAENSSYTLKNGFKVGHPMIWCSNNLAAAMYTQSLLWDDAISEVTAGQEDTRYLMVFTMQGQEYRDWLFGLNPWGQVMMILPDSMGIPSPQHPHSAMTKMGTVNGRPGRDWLVGGLVDGPVSGWIYDSLWGVHLENPDAYAPYQSRQAVYHDDFSDYSTNEPTMDGTASLLPMLELLCRP